MACNFRFLSIGFELESYGIPSPLLLRSVHYSVYRQVRVVFVHFSPEADSLKFEDFARLDFESS